MSTEAKPSPRILFLIVLCQFCCTSLWFAGNGVMTDLVTNFRLDVHALGHLTAAVQFGFIVGTLVFALLAIADRFSPSKVFFASAMFASVFNLGIIWDGNNLISLLSFRFLIGFFLAGIYPIGMKIAADYYDKELGKSLGYLVGALVIGTAFPHFLKIGFGSLPWRYILISTSVFSFVGGLLIVMFVPDGPFRRPGQGLQLSVLSSVFKNDKFRSAAVGYFGHMWELYAFWAFVPLMLETYNSEHVGVTLNVSLWSFLIIASGGVACVIAGYISQRIGTKQTATLALFLSGLCCLLSPFIFSVDSTVVFLSILLFWGAVVVADSPLFSTLVAQNAKAEIKGSALTIVNCIGFSITIISIQLVNGLQSLLSPNLLYFILALGPVVGLMALRRK